MRPRLVLHCLLPGLGALLASQASLAEYQWHDATRTAWPSAEAACEQGEGIRLLLQKREQNPRQQWRINNYSLTDIGGEAFCRFTVERKLFGRWLPDTYHFSSVYLSGGPDLCPSGVLDEGGQCCAQCQSNECNDSNPILGATGQKVQIEVDLSVPGSRLGFSRNYWSSRNQAGDLGVGWNHGWNQRIAKLTADRLKAYRDDGRAVAFTRVAGKWTASADERFTLVELPEQGGWSLTGADASVETYDALGQLKRFDPVLGSSLHFARDAAGRLVRISDAGGRQITLGYAGERLANLQFGNWNISYRYDERGRLASVLRGDEEQHYHYEVAERPHLLTGITDARGLRFATWTYDGQGRATSSSHAGENGTVQFAYLDANRVRITNPLGKSTLYHYQTFDQRRLVTRRDGEASAHCPAASQQVTYLANGLPASRTDWNGNLTTHQYDERGLEVSRTEAAGTPQARTITTTWHPTFALPLSVTEPGQVTRYQYDNRGRVIAQTTEAL